MIEIEDRDLFWYAESAQEIWDGIQTWHENAGSPNLPTDAPMMFPFEE